MSLQIIYGIGGYCGNCNSSHDHPLNNIIEEIELPNVETSHFDSAIEKLQALGLSETEINALLGRQ
jgi:hypothetical protein